MNWEPVEMMVGSPPHARGAVSSEPSAHHLEGITPACAGSSYISLWAWLTSWDHPRMRGEQSYRAPAADP